MTLLGVLPSDGKGKKGKIILVVSSKQDEGKLIVILNMGKRFELLQEKILIIYAKLRNNSVHEKFSFINIYVLTGNIKLIKNFEQ